MNRYRARKINMAQLFCILALILIQKLYQRWKQCKYLHFDSQKYSPTRPAFCCFVRKCTPTTRQHYATNLTTKTRVFTSKKHKSHIFASNIGQSLNADILTAFIDRNAMHFFAMPQHCEILLLYYLVRTR